MKQVLFILAFCILSPLHADERKPNVVLILIDDFGYECVTANGGESYKTPVMDKLAATGVRFEQCHAQPLCTPTRAQLMTGIGNRRNYTHFGHLDPSQVLRIVRKAARRAGITKAVSPHFLRHSHASHALDRGAAISLVQVTLNHSSVATTGRHLHARPSDSSSRYLPL